MPRSRIIGLGFGLISAICFGFSGPLARALIDGGLGPMQVVWIRLAGAALVLLAVTAVVRPRALAVPRARLPFVALYSLLGFAAVQACYYGTVSRLPVGTAILLEYASPVLVVAWVRIVRRNTLPWPAVFGAILAVAGLACVVQVWHGLRLDALGLVLGLATAASAAGYFLLTQETGEGLHPLGAITWGLVGATTVLVPLGRPWDLPWHLLAGRLQMGDGMVPAWQVVGALVLIATVIAYLASVVSVRRLSAAVGVTVASLEAISSILLAWLLLGQSLGTAQLLGGTIVLSGAILAQLTVSHTPEVDPTSVEPQTVSAQAESLDGAPEIVVEPQQAAL